MDSTQGVDYVFTPGNAGAGGKVIVSSSNINPETGVFELGTIQFDSLVSGGLNLTTCNYTDANATERTCDPSTLVTTVPEPGTGALLGLTLGALSARLRFSRRRSLAREAEVPAQSGGRRGPFHRSP